MSEPFVGEIRMFAGNFAPRGWAFCDGQLLAISQNDALFSLFGTVYGGDGRTTFALPDMRGRLPVHAGSGPGLSPRRLGAKSGSENVTLTVNQLPSHSHEFHASTAVATLENPQNHLVAEGVGVNFYEADNQNTNMASAMTGNTGGSRSHTNLMPFLCVNFIVALFGIFPSRT
ncbi:tail fiber protein [Phaeobacter sp. QD34_3]|uniref:phage tail protein n=1 Tax=unclassified Phaeobacter TaxID=2621772 RepID=UPI00237F6AFC|nr:MULTISPECIES: tail fiber protein [unclassified Phaeobacter]MDE4135067.1 tail fiber protein [Phaeobacter sp. QD34_3]MDE4138697.1 tail fiber protein [Phaeobacter sp. QD34_24]MDE4176452.1 tail fiber protein [Phaeobacter sp. PT47_59]